MYWTRSGNDVYDVSHDNRVASFTMGDDADRAVECQNALSAIDDPGDFMDDVRILFQDIMDLKDVEDKYLPLAVKHLMPRVKSMKKLLGPSP